MSHGYKSSEFTVYEARVANKQSWRNCWVRQEEVLKVGWTGCTACNLTCLETWIREWEMLLFLKGRLFRDWGGIKERSNDDLNSVFWLLFSQKEKESLSLTITLRHETWFRSDFACSKRSSLSSLTDPFSLLFWVLELHHLHPDRSCLPFTSSRQVLLSLSQESRPVWPKEGRGSSCKDRTKS